VGEADMPMIAAAQPGGGLGTRFLAVPFHRTISVLQPPVSLTVQTLRRDRAATASNAAGQITSHPVPSRAWPAGLCFLAELAARTKIASQHIEKQLMGKHDYL